MTKTSEDAPYCLRCSNHPPEPLMAAVMSALKSSGKVLAGPLLCAGLKAILDVPAEDLARWVKTRFQDHSGALPKAITAANDRAWQAVGLALAGDSLLSRITGLFRDGDLKAVQAQIRSFVADADTGLDGQPAGLRARACDELNRLKRDGRLSADAVQLESVDLTRFASTANVADDAHRAIRNIADDLAAECPHLSQVLTLAPSGGGIPLLAAAFAFFLRRQIAISAELSRELTHDQLRLLTNKQHAGFANLELSIGDQWDSLEATLGGWFATTDAVLDEVRADIKKLLVTNQVATKAESPLRVSVTSAEELVRLRKVRDRFRGLPVELINAILYSQLGDGEAAAGEYAHAQVSHGAAATAANESRDKTGEAEAAYKQFKDACELRAWDAALASLNRAMGLDEKRFRPVPKHYAIDSILGAGAFGVVLKCRDLTETDDNGNHVVVAVKTFRVSDLERPLEEIFAEASLLKRLTHPNVIGIHERGFADPDGQRRPFLAMEFFPGITLEDNLDKYGKLSLPDFLAVFGGIAAALHAAHSARRPIIHRDVKPANVMLMRVNSVWVVKVIDYGLAVKSAMRQRSRENSRKVPLAQRSTHDRSVTGTFKYAAPEQLGEKEYQVGPHSDVYAFGKSALEALLGTTNPTDEDWEDFPDLPAELKRLLNRCVSELYLADEPAKRRYHGFAPILKVLTALSPCARAGGGEEDKPKVEMVVPPLLVPTSPSKPSAILLAPAPPPPAQFVPKAGDKYEIVLPGGVNVAFAWCPPGSFLMGSQTTEKQRDTDENQHEVHLTRGFFAGVSPVTRRQFAAFVDATKYTTEAEMGEGGYVWKDSKWQMDPSCTWRMPGFAQADDHPVVVVSHDDAVAYAKWVSSVTTQAVRLLTEAEWEYAARGGTTMPFYWGGELNGTQANCDGNNPFGTSTKGPYLQQTTAVGSYAVKNPHPWGLTDVIGNVWEWCADWYYEGYYPDSSKEDPVGPVSGSDRVRRGGGWLSDAGLCRAAYRGWNSPASRSYDLGFRLAALYPGPMAADDIIAAKVGSLIEAKVGSLGDPYADGTPNLEIKLTAKLAVGETFVGSERTSVTLRVAGKNYDGSVLANKPEHETVWFSPTLVGPDGKRTSLGKVLTAAGYCANDTVSLHVSGTFVEVLPATGSSPASKKQQYSKPEGEEARHIALADGGIRLLGTSASAALAPREMDLYLEGDEIRIDMHSPGNSQWVFWVSQKEFEAGITGWDWKRPAEIQLNARRRQSKLVVVLKLSADDEKLEVQAGKWWMWLNAASLAKALISLGVELKLLWPTTTDRPT